MRNHRPIGPALILLGLASAAYADTHAAVLIDVDTGVIDGAFMAGDVITVTVSAVSDKAPIYSMSCRLRCDSDALAISDIQPLDALPMLLGPTLSLPATKADGRSASATPVPSRPATGAPDPQPTTPPRSIPGPPSQPAWTSTCDRPAIPNQSRGFKPIPLGCIGRYDARRASDDPFSPRRSDFR